MLNTKRRPKKVRLAARRRASLASRRDNPTPSTTSPLTLDLQHTPSDKNRAPTSYPAPPASPPPVFSVVAK